MCFQSVYNLFFSPHRLLVRKLNKILGFVPGKIHLYNQAFQHKSLFKNNNERLELLGDSILDAVVTEVLYHRFSKENEGDLSKLRSKIVSRKRLNHIGNDLNLLQMLQYRKSNIQTDGSNMAGNVLEALIGAVYLDKGYKRAARFVEQKILKPYINWDRLSEEIIDYKSLLHTYAQKENLELVYAVSSEKHQHDDEKFEVEVLLGGTRMGTGTGKNKKAAEQAASHKALISLNLIEEEN
jgi:ribonuclease III